MDRPLISLFRTQDIRQMDCDAIASGLSGYELMTRAAQASIELIGVEFSSARSLLVLCGAGNNAGDGYVAARLAQDLGFEVTVCAVTPVDRLQGDALRAWQDYERATCERRQVASEPVLPEFGAPLLEQCDLVVDALLGTGLSRDVEGEFARVIRCVNQACVDVLSLDVPSGLNSDTGLPQALAVRATRTLAFIALKRGLFCGEAAAYCGDITCDRLGLPDAVFERFTPVARVLEDRDVRSCLPPREAFSHKGDHGKVLIVGGDVGMSGAVVLSAQAALRSGAGTVAVACHERSHAIVAGYTAELMCHGVTDQDELESLVEASDVVVIGPGLGRRAWGRAMFDCVIKCSKPMVIDADALRLLSQQDPKLTRGALVLTPHPGEAGALLSISSSTVQADRFSAASKIARTFEAVVALKGAGTVVASNGRVSGVCPLGNPGMATAGTGDVLTGVVAGIWAQQPKSTRTSRAHAVASAAVYVHAKAGDRAAEHGERGLIASDLLNYLRQCVNFDL